MCFTNMLRLYLFRNLTQQFILSIPLYFIRRKTKENKGTKYLKKAILVLIAFLQLYHLFLVFANQTVLNLAGSIKLYLNSELLKVSGV